MEPPIIRDEHPPGSPPATKVPVLDIIDHYLSLPTEYPKGYTETVEVSWSTGVSRETKLVESYARFVSGLTGADEVAFIIARGPELGSPPVFPSTGIVSAVIDQSTRQEDGYLTPRWKEFDMSYYQEGEIQFALDLGASVPDNCSTLERQHLFVLHILPSSTATTLVINISYPSQQIPELAAAQLLKIFISQLPNDDTLYTSAASPAGTVPELSVVNHPPLMEPPSQFSSNWDVAIEPTLLHAGFEHWASKSPSSPALDFVLSLSSAKEPARHQTLSYGMLNKAANFLACHLRDLVPHGTIEAKQCIVPIYMSTSLELYISYLAVLKAGFAFSPLPMEAPLERIRELLQDIMSPVVLGIGEKPDSWVAGGIETAWIDATQVSRWKTLLNQDTPVEDTECDFEAPPITSSDLAYLLFTSGSTGKPKGVEVSHLAAACSIGSHSTAIPLPATEHDGFRWFQFAAPTFDPSLMEIFVTLSNGGTLCSAPRTLTLSDLEGTINETRATVMMATPSLAALLRPSHLNTLRSLWTMGEKLNRTVIDNFGLRSTATPYTLVNAYGPTEAAINCTFLAPVKYSDRGSIIGEALPTCSMLILDHRSRVPKVLPSGFVGELAIGGPQVSKGYLHRPEETAKAYVFSADYGRLYRTGDLARIVWDESGRQLIEFLGRITSDQVKLSGRRVELSEIESVLAVVPGVTELVTAVSKADNGKPGSERIVACIVATAQSSDEKHAVVDGCCRCSEKHLPPYMRPSAYIFLDTLPRSSSGKVDRKKIRLDILQADISNEFFVSSNSQDLPATHDEVQPHDESLQHSTQAILITALSEAVGEPSSAISLKTSLASLGLDSLGAVRLLQKLRDCSIDGLTVGDVLQSGTVQTLAAKVVRASQTQDSDLNSTPNQVQLQQSLDSFAERNLPVCVERLGLLQDQIRAVLPTTATQSGMLASFLRSSTNTSRSYIYHSVMPTYDGVDLEKLKGAWDTVISGYDSFRTVFCHLDDDQFPFAQCILRPNNSSVNPIWSTYGGNSENSNYDAALELALQNAELKIDIGTNPWHISLVSSANQSAIVLSMFHGIFDGGSLQLLLQDVTTAYDGKPLPERTSLEHIVHHHFSADSEATAKFWNKHLEGHSPVAFPSLSPYRPTSKPKAQMVEIDSHVGYSELTKASRSIGVTPLSVLQAAWGSILLAYSGTPEQDVVIGSVVSGRLDPLTENCIGPTFTTVPIRINLSNDQHAGPEWTNRSMAQHLVSLNAESLSHLQPRLGSLVTADGRLPYDTLLAYQDFNAGSGPDALWTSIHHPPMANDFAVMVEVWPGRDSGLTLRASFRDETMDHDAAELMLREFSLVLSHILGHPDDSFLNNTLVSDVSLKSVLDPVVPQEHAPNALIHSQFEAHAKSNPDDHALLFRSDLLDENNPANICWTYGELNAKAQLLAGYLISLFGPLTGSIVPIHIEKSPALYVAILGTLKTGGAWCPIDVFSPAQRRHDLVVRTKAKLVLVSSADSIQIGAGLPNDVLPIDAFPFTQESEHVSDTQASGSYLTDPTNMAYMIWTSGTTGAPKGVPITHLSAFTSINSLLNAIPGGKDGEAVRCLQFSQPTFDVSIQDMFFTWSCGGVLISAPRDVMLGSFAELANVTGATHAHLTPTFSAGVRRSACKTLQTITMIGEKLPQPVADDWGQDMRAFNTYGPAEATIVSTLREFGNEHKHVRSGNIGWPLKSVSVFVTRDNKFVMKNAVGELALGGPQLSPGYLDQGDTTKARYVWNEEAGQILYYTGDLVRMLADGSLEYLNRADDLVKLGGIRVELSEISFSLRCCHPLAESIETMVLNRPDRPNDAVVAFIAAPQAVQPGQEAEILLSNDTAISIARSAIKQASLTLPAHMIPSTFLVVSSIPKTQSAKADRRALQAVYAELELESWDRACNVRDENYEAATDKVDRKLADSILSEISLLANVSTSLVTESSRLRSLGIDSIRAIRLASRLNKADYRLSVIDVLQCETVRDLMMVAGSSSKGSLLENVFDPEQFNLEWRKDVSALIHESFFVCPARAIQEGFLSETMTTSEMYWSNHFFTLHPDVDMTKLKEAWTAVCQGNEALRTGLLPVAALGKKGFRHASNFGILQIIYERHEIDWKDIECTTKSYRHDLDRRLADIRNGHQANYFQRPPWAVTVLDDGGEKTMVFTIHHVLHDGQSLGFILNDVYHAYTSEPPKRPQLRNVLPVVLPSNEACLDAQKFWERELEEYAELDVPAWPDLTGQRTVPEKEQDRHFISETARLSVGAVQLEAKSVELGVSSIASIVRSAFGLVLSRYLGTSGVVFAETISDRVLDADVDDAIGPFISVVPIPFNPKGTVREVLAEQHRLSTNAREHRHIHAAVIRRLLNKERGESLYPAIFTFHSNNEQDLTAGSGGTIWDSQTDDVGLTVEHPMALNLSQGHDGDIMLEASSLNTIMSCEQLVIFVRQIDALVSAMLDYPDESFTSLPRFIERDLLSISAPSPSKAVRGSVQLGPEHWVEVNAEKRPEWTAVEEALSITSAGAQQLFMSYGELNGAANRIAAYLSRNGVKNRSIALCSRRNLASYPVLLGIMKSGNAYLPIDEGLPDDRKSFLVEDGDAPVIFTETAFASTFNHAPSTCRIICIDGPSFQQELLALPSENRSYAANPHDTAYILYTSGSTGKPKGVMITRANLSSFIESLSEFVCKIAPATLELGGKGRWLGQASRAFDPHIAEMFFPWRHGMATSTGPRTLLMDDLRLTLAKLEITHAGFVPSLLDQADIRPQDCPSLRLLSVGGEKISQRVLDTWGRASQVAIMNAYGPTEMTVGCSFALVNEHATVRNIGLPLTSCACHVLLPDSLEYALRGQAGELCFTGDIVGKGYLNRSDAKGFVTGPNLQKMYRTGDVGRIMADGSIEYLGRGDDQTKIRGQRLELGEVSEVLRTSSRVPIDVVTTIAKHPGLARSQLISFITRLGAQRRDVKEPLSIVSMDIGTLGKDLRDKCRQKLPSYMVPDIVFPVNRIPYAAMSDKVNIKPLQELFESQPLPSILGGNESTHGGLKENRPLTADEEVVVDAICDTIAVDRPIINHDTNIFEIGIDSLSAINLSVRLRNAGLSASVALIMSNAVVEQLARLPWNSTTASQQGLLSGVQKRFSNLESEFFDSHSTEIGKSAVSCVRPCLPLQEGLVARSMNSDSAIYVNHVVLKMNPAVDPVRLQNAWQKTSEQTEILRTVFVPLPSEIVQVVLEPNRRVDWTERQYDGLEEAVADFQIRQDAISQDITDNITSIPPLRILHAVTMGSRQPLALFISIHHSLYDGASFGMLLQDFAAQYGQDKPSPKRGSPDAFIRYVCSQNMDESRSHWCQALCDCRPTIFEKPARDSAQLAYSTILSSSLSELEGCAARLQSTVSSLMQAVFALVLADAVGTSDVTYGLVLSGRTVPIAGADSVLLPCIATIPGRLKTEHLSTVEDVIHQVHKATAESLEYQHTSLRYIQRWIKSEGPIFDCLFSFIRSTEYPGHDLWEEMESTMPSDYPLALEVEADAKNDCVRITCGFAPAFGQPEDARDFVGKMNLIVSTMVSNESISLGSFSLSRSAPTATKSTVKDWDDHPWSSLEQEICDMLKRFCGLEGLQISRKSSFLSLGLDSVTAIRFSSQLRDTGIPVSSADVMRFPCVGALAQSVVDKAAADVPSPPQSNCDDDAQLDEFASQVERLSPNDAIGPIFKCSPLQTAMITQTIASNGVVYVHPHIMRLAESTSVERLKEAYRVTIEANDILRTSFHPAPQMGSTWIGVVHSDVPPAWQEITVPAGSDIAQVAMRCMQLGTESAFCTPPIRPVIVNEPGGSLLVLVMHHALYDGVSLPFIFDDLASAYRGVSLPDRPPFANAVRPLSQHQSEACQFWTKLFDGYQVIPLSRSPHHQPTAEMFYSESDIELSMPDISERCKEMEVTVQSVAILAYAKVLAKLTGRRDVAFGQVLAGRSSLGAEAERVVGPLFNTVAKRVTLEPKLISNRNMVQQIQSFTVEAQSYEHAPLHEVQKSLRQSGVLCSTTLVDTLFVFEKHVQTQEHDIAYDEIWKPYVADGYIPESEYKLNLQVEQTDTVVTVRASCKGEILAQEDLNQALRDFRQAFCDIVEHPSRCMTLFPDELQSLPLSLGSPAESAVSGADTSAPSHEPVVQGILSEVSRVAMETIQPDTSIFSIGLDSLSAIRVASLCRAAGLKAGVADVLQGNTLRGISLRVQATPQEDTKQSSLIGSYSDIKQVIIAELGLKPNAIDKILPCLSGQMYHLASWLQTGRALFEPAWPFSCSERIDAETMKDAWLSLRQNNPILRTCFYAISPSEAVQVILNECDREDGTFQVITSEESLENLALHQARDIALHPSSLKTPPVRLRLLKANDRDGILIVMNHAIYDAWTMPLFVDELASHYRRETPTSRPGFASFLEFTMQSLKELDEPTYWRSAVGNSVPTLIGPALSGDGDAMTPKSKQLFVGAWEAVKNLGQLDRTCRSSKVSLQAIVILAVSRVLAQLTGVSSPTMGLYQTGRSAAFPDIDRLTSPCLNVTPFTVPDALSENGSETFQVAEKAKSIQAALAERIPYEQSSLRDILTCWSSTRDTSSSLFNVWLNLLWIQSPSQPREDAPESTHSKSLFAHLPIGVPTDFMPSEPFADEGGFETSVSKLDISYLPQDNVYIDIAPDVQTDTIGFGIRVQGGLMNEQEIHAFVGRIGEEIEALVQWL
ncbi:hypothetical protein FDECE_13287 [Fusarium decemcellulare]|nr:hypothetical protein FDECE_13287 [Fusarium decemcellulare]